MPFRSPGSLHESRPALFRRQRHLDGPLFQIRFQRREKRSRRFRQRQPSGLLGSSFRFARTFQTLDGFGETILATQFFHLGTDLRPSGRDQRLGLRLRLFEFAFVPDEFELPDPGVVTRPPLGFQRLERLI
jgi:hypothetical protein